MRPHRPSAEGALQLRGSIDADAAAARPRGVVRAFFYNGNISGLCVKAHTQVFTKSGVK
jgi:hypothetical protein